MNMTLLRSNTSKFRIDLSLLTILFVRLLFFFYNDYNNKNVSYIILYIYESYIIMMMIIIMIMIVWYIMYRTNNMFLSPSLVYELTTKYITAVNT